MVTKYSLGGMTLLMLSTMTMAKTTYADVQISHLKPSKEQMIWIRENPNTPKYPLTLAKAGVRGCAVYSFDITGEGDIENIELMSAIPGKTLSKEAKKLLNSWHWQVANNKQAALEHKVIRLDFCIGGDTIEQAQQQCIAQSQLACSANG
ncbi:energy transducer TonB [Pseudoalteromonas sp. KG3]|uniref:energy transducer TonB n=1 Tax=Pseudoalteromonas TaxID=53246 RepID=UPI0024BC0068|nr:MULTISPECIES: energy transducer TonB [Pseudoalteromonas]WKD25613.1 energy transducer TonB [Pseudoalteromonas sp. KG3]